MESLRSWGQRACAHCGDAMTPTVVRWDCLSCSIPRKGGGKGKDGCGSPFSPDEANTSSEEREEGSEDEMEGKDKGDAMKGTGVDVDPRPVQPLELPAYAWLLVKEYSYRHEQWCKKTHYGFCGQNCPCCRFAAGDFLGACEVGLGVRTLASVSAAVRIALTHSIDHAGQPAASSISSGRPQQLASRSRSPRQRRRTMRSS